MTNSPHTTDKAEQVLNQAVQNLPWRRAPAELEAGVLQQLERRRIHAWWRRGFSHWPIAARAGFVAVCISLVSLTLLDSRWSSWAYFGVGSLVSTVDVFTRIAGVFPEKWVFTAAAAAGTLYAVLFGLGAVAYRTLYLSPPQAR